MLVDHTAAPSVLTVQVPAQKARGLEGNMVQAVDVEPVRPCGRVGIDMLMPTADADRQIQVGTCPSACSWTRPPEGGGGGREPPHLDISVELGRCPGRTCPSRWNRSSRHIIVAGRRRFGQHALVDLSRVKWAAALPGPCGRTRYGAVIRRRAITHEALEALAAKLSWPSTADDAET